VQHSIAVMLASSWLWSLQITQYVSHCFVFFMFATGVRGKISAHAAMHSPTAFHNYLLQGLWLRAANQPSITQTIWLTLVSNRPFWSVVHVRCMCCGHEVWIWDAGPMTLVWG
jgi:hypothetical protein